MYFFDQINAALVNINYFFSKTNITEPKNAMNTFKIEM